MATEYQPIIDRVYEVLTDGAGAARTLSEANRFATGLYPGQELDHQARDARQQKRCWVAAGPLGRGDESEVNDRALYNVSVRVDLTYALEPAADQAAWREIAGLMPLDAHRIRGALGFPGNLTATAGGDPTGLASGCLLFESWTPAEPLPSQRLWRASASFVGRLTLTY